MQCEICKEKSATGVIDKGEIQACTDCRGAWKNWMLDVYWTKVHLKLFWRRWATAGMVLGVLVIGLLLSGVERGVVSVPIVVGASLGMLVAWGFYCAQDWWNLDGTR